MTTKIFMHLCCQFEARMGSANRKVDKCPAHLLGTTVLKNIKVVFFPANCTSRLQPFHVGVIHVVRKNIRKHLFRRQLLPERDRQN
jgi:hypothetical protein